MHSSWKVLRLQINYKAGNTVTAQQRNSVDAIKGWLDHSVDMIGYSLIPLVQQLAIL
jgi:hypothetical protein